ncbi:hypothetical protein QCA50_016918 [Cerrena zonata]|uniref:Ribosomal protein S10 n=1 Tax=Cerrena zonata TaxID=2478898 RepID=A0AAW0FI79_9APHY
MQNRNEGFRVVIFENVAEPTEIERDIYLPRMWRLSLTTNTSRPCNPSVTHYVHRNRTQPTKKQIDFNLQRQKAIPINTLVRPDGPIELRQCCRLTLQYFDILPKDAPI